MRETRRYGPGYAPQAEDIELCIESVAEGGRSVSSYQCRKKRGHGPDGLYCTQHASKFPVGEGETWYEVTSYGINEMQVYGETEKTIQVRYGNLLHKVRKSGNEYRSLKEALEEQLSRQKAKLERAEKDYNETLEKLKAL